MQIATSGSFDCCLLVPLCSLCTRCRAVPVLPSPSPWENRAPVCKAAELSTIDCGSVLEAGCSRSRRELTQAEQWREHAANVTRPCSKHSMNSGKTAHKLDLHTHCDSVPVCSCHGGGSRLSQTKDKNLACMLSPRTSTGPMLHTLPTQIGRTRKGHASS